MGVLCLCFFCVSFPNAEKEKKNTDSVKCANGKVKLWEEEMEDVGVFNVYKTKRLSVLNRVSVFFVYPFKAVCRLCVWI